MRPRTETRTSEDSFQDLISIYGKLPGDKPTELSSPRPSVHPSTPLPPGIHAPASYELCKVVRHHQHGIEELAHGRTPITDLNDPRWESDPANALNWSFRKKAYHSFVAALMCLARSARCPKNGMRPSTDSVVHSTFASSVYAPAVQNVQKHFHVSSTAALLPLSVYIYGLAFGPLIGAPISETHGRRYVYLISMPLFLAFTAGSAAAPNFEALLICRFLSGVLGSPPLAVGAGTNLDMWPSINRAQMVTFYSYMPFLGPAIGPVVGGFVVTYKSWRWTQWTIVFLGSIIYLFSLGVQETYAKIILRKRAKRLGLPLPPDTSPKGTAALKLLLTMTITRPLHMLFTEPIVALYSAYAAFNFSVLYCFFAAFPPIFAAVYQFNLWQTGLIFLGITVGCTIGAVIAVVVDHHTYVKELVSANDRMGRLPPEKRLYTAMIGSVCLPIGLFWFGWSARPDVHWIVPEIATVFFACGSLLVFV